ncbi:MAG: site-2 protease family protein [Acidimicrobiales bacterium]
MRRRGHELGLVAGRGPHLVHLRPGADRLRRGRRRPGALIGLFAVVNIFIGMFNLVPLLPFDGGHVAIAVYERIQEKRLHYGERRYFTDVSRLLPLTYGVVVLLAMLFVTSMYLDIVNPVGG